MWRWIGQSVGGTSHRRHNTDCQDCLGVGSFIIGDDDFLVIACSDGAGSAKESQTGSRLAVGFALQKAEEHLRADNGLSDTTADWLRQCTVGVRGELEREASAKGLTLRDFACTLSVTILGQRSSAFLQVGDGAIVILENGAYRPIFWPKNGEYANETFFVTDDDADQQVMIELLPSPVNEVAVFTDGLQPLALDYGKKTAHEPFISAMLAALKESTHEAELSKELGTFLDSEKINARTDDDKTLILAVRAVASGSDLSR